MRIASQSALLLRGVCVWGSLLAGVLFWQYPKACSSMQVFDPIVEGSLVSRPGNAKAASTHMRQLATAATFVASGLVHEVLFWCAWATFFRACAVHSLTGCIGVAYARLLVHAYGRPQLCTESTAANTGSTRETTARLRRYIKGWAPGVAGGFFLWFAAQAPLLMAESVLRKWTRARGFALPAVLRNALTWAVLLPLADHTYYKQVPVVVQRLHKLKPCRFVSAQPVAGNCGSIFIAHINMHAVPPSSVLPSR